ncbi:protein FAR1-RELATED SEQUENCE 5-like [Papaver somniferum]|uniref:protein FAR1-RELATED SEQUENCE 5-like n=1 Tax=Papaver somniferum TaxID=3469 RepID=UPI000E704D57|nr:protein FAR1-RELATED SEQUENCE 5-like [Papaver somniferum]
MDELVDHDTLTPNKNNNSLETPHEGMQFNSYEEAREYYTEYGRHNGFTVQVRSTNRTRRGVEEVTAAYMVCSREGNKVKVSNIEGVDKKSRSCNTIQCGCTSKMQILLNEENNMWVVMAFSDEHNHKFVSPRKRMRMRSNKCMPGGVKDLAEKFNIQNLEVGKIPAILEGQNIGFNKRDCWNHLRNVRHKNLELGDAQSVIDYLHKKQGENPQFFYRVQVDEHGRAVNFFWVDARSRLSYEQFGEDETEPTFLWLFSIWLEAMGEQHPLTIITDQDSAMAGAIKKVAVKA